MSLIDAGVRYRQKPWFPVSHPVNLPCSVVCQRLLLVLSCRKRLWLLVAKNTSSSETHVSLPVTVSERGYSIQRAVHRLIQECTQTASPVLCGILGVQHHAGVLGQSDGICFNTLMTLKPKEEGAEFGSPPLMDSENYMWCEVTNQSLKSKILKRIEGRSFLPMYNL